MSFSIGMLRVITAASEPSASAHLAPGFTPASRSRVETATPVHRLQLVSPTRFWAVSSGLAALRQANGPFPEHSRKTIRLTDGNLRKSSRLRKIGRSDDSVDVTQRRVGPKRPAGFASQSNKW